MKKIPHTYRTKNGYYYFRLVLPVHIQPYGSTKEIRFSLHTSDYKVAKQRAYKAWLDCYNLISNNKFHSESLHEVISQMSNNKFQSIQLGESTKELISLSDTVGAYDLISVKGLLDYLIGTNQELYCEVEPHNVMIYPLTKRVDSDGVITEHVEYLSDDKDKTNFNPKMAVLTTKAIDSISNSLNDKFCIEEYKSYFYSHWSLSDGFIKLIEPLQAITTSIYKVYIDKNCYEKVKDLSIAPKHTENLNRAKSFSLTQAWEDFSQSHDWTNKTRNENTQIFSLLVEIVGDINIRDIIYEEHLIPFKEIVCKLPPNRNKGKCKGMSAREAADYNHSINGKTLSDNTLAKYGNRMSSYFEYFKDKGTISVNPARKLFSKKKDNPKDDREPFTPDELKIIFCSSAAITLFNKKDSLRNPSRLWGYLILLYSGARAEEVYSLRLNDIDIKSSVPSISINDSHHDKHLKTQASNRKIPIHPTLIELGLKEYITKATLAQKGVKDKLLFPELNYTDKHGYSRKPSRWFNESLLVNLDIKTSKKVLHSFRHNVIDKLYQNIEVNPLYNNTYIGHKRGEHVAQERYGSELSPEKLKAVLALIKYDLDFDKIKSTLKKLIIRPIRNR